ncbi:hypothetical protein ACFOW1_02400 [Parasediminibacterium paludis]|uniref:DUF4476 domain-containing protein n=1 Tax=Parasediminibacterium paludis TaxID=908966 RepID=A0ABV8PUA4_9BACT
MRSYTIAFSITQMHFPLKFAITNVITMKLLIPILLMGCLLSASANAQQNVNHFIYFQSETKEPFYVMLNGINYSSSINGYLILPKLKSGEVNFKIGFARDKYPEQSFATIIANNDLGYALRLNADKQWELFNLEDFSIVSAGLKSEAIYSTNVTAQAPTVTKTVETVTPGATTTTSVNAVAKPQATSTLGNDGSFDFDGQPKKLPNISVNNDGTINILPKTDVATNGIKKLSSIISETGVTEVYIDKGDTVRVFVPNATTSKADSTTAVKANLANKVDKSVKNCTFATNEDFLKTRAKMAAAEAEYEMLNIGAQAFKDKCFSVEQVKYLSYLLIEEENKLTFFLSAKKTVYDTYNFPTLQKLLTKPETIEQFRKALQ